MVQIWKVTKHGVVTLRVLPMLAAPHNGHSIDVTLAIDSDQKEVQRGLLRLDPSSSASDSAPGGALVVRVPHAPISLALSVPQATTGNTTPEFDFDFAEQDFVAMFANGRTPSLRIIIDVQ